MSFKSVTRALVESLRRWDGVWTHWSPRAQIGFEHVPRFRVMTFNVWFDSMFRRERAEELFRLIKEYNPDVICLQEVTPSFLTALRDSKCLNDGAVVSDIFAKTFQGYGVIAISNSSTLCPTSFELTSMPTEMGRSLLCVDFKLNNETVSVGTVHLESLDTAPIRRAQLEIAHSAMSKYDNAFLMGDFNFDDKRNWNINATPLENDTMKEALVGWVDTWQELHPNEEGKTFDTTTNPVLRTHKFEKMRYDRIMYRSKSWKPVSIEMVGTKPFTVNGVELAPSDHFGLVADFVHSSK